MTTNTATGLVPDTQAAARTRRALQAQGVYLSTTGAAPRTAFLFPGHGAQYPDMFADLVAAEPVVEETFDRVDDIYRKLAGRTLTSRIFRSGGGTPAEELIDPTVMQPAIFAGSLAVFRLLGQQGVVPEVLIGHSLGEISALVAAGALTLEDGVRAVYGRGAAVKSIAPDRRGGMLSVHTDGEDGRRELARLLLLAGGPRGLTRSIVNAPDQTVLSGDFDTIRQAEEVFRERGMKVTRLRVSHGFHSTLLADAVPLLQHTLTALDWNEPRIPVLSSVIGDHYTSRDVPDLPALLAQQLVTPFSFQDLVGQLHADGINTYVEVGPKSILSGLVERILDGQEVLVTPTNVQSLGGVESIRRFNAFADVHGLRTGQSGPQRDGASGTAGKQTVSGRLRAELLEVVARTTGYPLRLLDTGQRMGTGLGLSARVRTELAAALATHAGLPSIDIDTDRDAPLGEMLDRVVEATRQAGNGSAAASRPEPRLAAVPEPQVSVAPEPPAVPQPPAVPEPRPDSRPEPRPAPDLSVVPGPYPDAAAPAPAEPGQPSPAPGVAAAEPQAPAEPPAELTAEVEQVVWRVAENKSGYPADLLEADLELEADLGIDSVKQAEILGEVRESFSLPVVEDLDLAELNTLRKVSAFIAALRTDNGRDSRSRTTGRGADESSDDDHHADHHGNRDADRHAADPGEPRDAPRRLPPVLGRALDRIAGRYVPVAVQSPLDHPDARPFSVEGKAAVVVTGPDTRLAAALLPLLAARGARPHLVAPRGAEADGWPTTHADFTDPASLTAALDAARGDGAQLVVNLHPYGAGPGEPGKTSFDLAAGEFTAQAEAQLTVNLLAAQSCYADLGRAGAAAGYFAATAVGGVFGLEADGAMDPVGGVTAGFVKSLDLELAEARVKAVDFTDGDPESAAAALIEEITTDAERSVEVGYAGGVRKIVQVLPHEIESHELRQPLDLPPGSVVVFSGGSRGITFECAKELARMDGVRVVILGRTAPPAGDEDWLRLDDEEFARLGRDWFKQARAAGRSLTPVEAKREFTRLANRRALERNLAELRGISEESGYEVCDVADAGEVAAAMERIRERHGRIDGVVHAAGLESVASVPRKNLEHARNVVRVKAAGAHQLWRSAADSPELRFFCFFGSFLGRFGMDGQVDYTAGADLVSKLSALLARERPEMKVFTLCWTGWADVGMAATEAVRKIQEQERGLAYLSVEEGVQHFAREVFEGGDDPEVLVFGEIGKNSYGGQDATMDATRTAVADPVGTGGRVRDRLALPMLDAVLERTERHAVASRRLDPRTDRYLPAHQVRGAGTLPGVLHLDAQAQTAGLLLPGARLAGVQDVRFVSFVKYRRKLPTELRIRAWRPEPGGDVRDGTAAVHTEITSDLVTAGGQVIEQDRLHSLGTHLFGTPQDPPPEPDPDLPRLLASARELDLDRFYAAAAHHITFGPTFRQVRRIGVVGDVADGRVLSEIAVTSGRGLFSDVATPKLRTMPLVIDNAWRSTLLWAYHRLGIHVVPVSIAAIRLHRVPVPGETVYSDSTVTETATETASGDEGGRLSIDTRITDAAGAVLCEIDKLLVTQVGRDEGHTDLLA